MHRVTVALYGRVKLVRFYCTSRHPRGFIVEDDEDDIACCGQVVPVMPTTIERMSDSARGRAYPSKATRDAALDRQRGLCLYCDRAFGEHYEWRGKFYPVLLVWDHRVPYAYDQNSHSGNFVAACFRCNAWKADHIFKTVEEARGYVARRWEAEAKRAGNKAVREMPRAVSDVAP